MTNDEQGWNAVAVLPNINLATPIEGGLIALVPCSDPRMGPICRAQPALRTFLGRFRDAFGQRLSPAVVIVRCEAEAKIATAEAVAGFRDAIVLATVPYNRAQ